MRLLILQDEHGLQRETLGEEKRDRGKNSLKEEGVVQTLIPTVIKMMFSQLHHPHHTALASLIFFMFLCLRVKVPSVAYCLPLVSLFCLEQENYIFIYGMELW